MNIHPPPCGSQPPWTASVRETGLLAHGRDSGRDVVRETGLLAHGRDSGGDAVRGSGVSVHGMMAGGRNKKAKFVVTGQE